jgi:hypothetical protein
MQLRSIPIGLTRLARSIVTLAGVLLWIGLSLEWIPFGWVALLFMWALLLPFCWPRQFGSWQGLLVLLIVSWLPVVALNVASISATTTNLLLLLMLAALLAAPGALVLLMRRRSASAALMLLGFALFPCQFTMLLARTGAPPLDPVGTGDALLSNLAWLPGIWYPMLGMCLGSVGFLLALSFLLVREARRAV